MRILFGLLLLFLSIGMSYGQTIFSPDFQGEQSPQPLSEDPRANAVATGNMGTTSGSVPSLYAGNPALTIPASPNGVGDNVRGTNPPRAVGVEDNGQVRASNIVARIRGEQSQPQAAQKIQQPPKK